MTFYYLLKQSSRFIGIVYRTTKERVLSHNIKQIEKNFTDHYGKLHQLCVRETVLEEFARF